MLSLSSDDDTLACLQGVVLRSHHWRDVGYRVEDRVLGEGGSAITLFALRVAPEGSTAVVLKILRPSFVAASGPTALMLVEKEAVALGRLNERVPTTPFVVRLIDTGILQVEYCGQRLDLPWLVLEYVYGGIEGTTVTERVAHSVRVTQAAFEPQRAALAIESLCLGLSAVHEVGVIHRDVKPDNILCCGFGDDEIFKVADFGVARPAGVVATFGGLLIGTPGFAPPEFGGLDQTRVGPWSDVFSAAATAYYVLTGEEYFPGATPSDAMQRPRNPARRSICDAAALSPDLRGRSAACHAIDVALARATALRIEDRPQTAAEFGASITSSLRTDSRRTRPASSRVDDIVERESTRLADWRWLVRWNPGGAGIVRDVAWTGDGRCMAATSNGLVFWNGTEWLTAPDQAGIDPDKIQFVRRISSGRWLVGGDAGSMAIYTAEGIEEAIRASDESIHLDLFDGDLDDLAIFVGVAPQAPPALHALVGKRWLRPLPLPDASKITSLARIGDAQWLVSGRSNDGTGYVAVCDPLWWRVRRIETPPVRTYVAAAGHPDRRVGVAVGSEGAVVWCDRDEISIEQIREGRDISAAGIDVAGRGWAASAGTIWLRQDGRDRPWHAIWEEPSWTAPIVSIFANFGIVIAITADGGIVEGRAEMSDDVRSPRIPARFTDTVHAPDTEITTYRARE